MPPEPKSPSRNHLATVKDSVIKRGLLYQAIREFFRARGHLEVETPLLARQPDCEISIDPFATEFISAGNGPVTPLYLSTSPEYAMKQLLCAGLPRIFQITRSFRNGECMRFHQPEFSLLEFYEAGATQEDFFLLFEDLLPQLARRLAAGETTRWQGKDFHWQKPYARISLREMFPQWVGLELDPFWSDAEFQKALAARGVTLSGKNLTWNEIFTQVLVEKIEPNLPKDRPYFLVDYPLPEAALAKEKADRPGWSWRFEVFLGAVELANGFVELTDAALQRQRFQQNQESRRRMEKQTYPLPEDFLRALEAGVPESTGCAVGLDRLLMLLLEKERLSDVLPFPYDPDLAHTN